MASSLAYVTDDLFEEHAPPRRHPERPERLAHLRRRLGNTRLARDGNQLRIRSATDVELGQVHAAGYLETLERTMPGRTGWLDGDTYFSEKSWEAARVAAGACIDVTRIVLSGEAERGLALVRPPGHHAEADRAMGFCVLNNAAVAAASARAAGAARVAVLDFDVHHGNGTENIFAADPDVMYLSVHQYPHFPGSGAPTDIGTHKGAGATVNVGLPAGCGDAEYRDVFDRVFNPALAAFKPDILIASAGYDAAAADPLSSMKVSARGYRMIGDELCAMAERYAGGRLVAMLEGGYDLDGLADGVVGMIEAMMEARGGHPGEPEPARIAPRADAAIMATLAAHPELGRS